MKTFIRFLYGLGMALLAAAAAQAQTLTATGIGVSPGSAKPGDQVTIAISVSNADAAADYTAATDFTVLLTHLTTGATFTITQTGVTPVGGFVAKATVEPSTNKNTPGTGSFNVVGTVPTQFTQSGGYRAQVTMTPTAQAASTFSVNSSVLTVTGSPDLQITRLDYNASTSYVGGTVIAMSLDYRNNSATNGTTNVPYTPGINGYPTYVRIQVVLSSNPTFGDADDFQLTIQDIHAGNVGTVDNAGNPVVEADGSTHTFNWQQVLPGNFSGSYYVMAKIDSLGQLTQNDPPALTIDGNNIWGVPALQPQATRINLLPSNFPTAYLGSHATGSTSTSNGYSDNPSVTSDGRYVAFASDATNLVAGDTNAARDIFIFDYQTTLVRRVSVSQQGAQGNGASNSPAISGNGRYVAFSSDANNLIVGDTNGFSDIYVVDVITGLISRVSVATGGGQANNPSFRPAISSTGRFIVFESSATNLDTAYTVASGSHIYLHDRDVSGSGTFDTAGNVSTRLVDVDSATPASVVANAGGIQAAISSDGSTIAFSSRGTNLVAPATTAARQHVYTRARTNVGTATSGIRLISVADTTAAEGGADSQTPSLSSTGRYVAFASLASNLVAADNNQVSDIFVYDTAAPVGTPIVRRMSVSSGGVEGYDPSAASFRLGSINPTISSDGRFVAFASLAANLTAGDSIGKYQGNGATATANLTAGAVTSFTVGAGGTQYSQSSTPLVIIVDPTGTGASGTAVVSAAGVITGINVTAGGAGYTAPIVTIASDANSALDIFVRDRDVNASGTFDTGGNVSTQMVSVNGFGYQSSGLLGVPSTAASNIYPVLSADGRYVAFPSDAENNGGFAFGATNQLPFDSNGWRDIFLFDRRTTASITPGTPPVVTITSPGNNGTALVNTAIPINASATTTIGVVSSVEFFVNGTSQGVSSVFPYTQTWTPTAVGTYTLSALVTDSFGNIGVSPNVTVTINAAPSVGVTSPVPGASIVVNTLTNITATAAASNPGATIASVQFYVNGASQGTVAAAPYSVAWTPTLPGVYSLVAVATDSIGTQTTSPTVSVTVVPVGGGGGGGGGGPVVIGIAPTVSVTSPATATQLPVNTPALVTATAADADGNITSVQFFANGQSIGSSTTYPYSTTWTPTSLGNYALTAEATDNSGNAVTSVAVQVTVADPASALPTVAVTSPTAAAVLPVGAPQTLQATATDAVAVTGVQFFVNGQPQGALVTTFPFVASWTPATPGTYTITARAINVGGNQATSAPVTVTVSAGTPPTVAVSNPIAGATIPVGSTQVLRATATDAVAVTNVQFFVNGQPQGPLIVAFPFSTDWTPATPGTYAIAARATNASGNQALSAAVTVTVTGGTPATVSVATPVAGASLPVNTTQTITATATSTTGTVANVQFFVNGVSVGSDATFPYSSSWTPTALGSYSILARVTDNFGNITDSTPSVVTVVAGGGPTVTLSNPIAGSVYSVGTTLNLAATAADADGIVTQVAFFVNNVQQGTPDVSAPYSNSWTPTASGVYSLTAQATDNSGNVTTSAPISVTINANGAPAISITSPASSSTASAGTVVNLTANATDADGRISGVRYFVNGNVVGTTATVPPFLTAWTPSAVGTYTIVAEATDDSGNITNSAARVVTVITNQPPNIALTSPAAGSSTSANLPVDIAALASDNDGTVVSVRFLVNNIITGSSVSAPPYAVTWTPTATGTYSIVAEATDNSGNISASAARTVNVVANQPPTVLLTTPASAFSAIVGLSVNLAATAFDNDGRVARVRFLVNGNAVGGSLTTAPYATTWIPTSGGTYSIVAEATDDVGNIANSNAVVATIFTNSLPNVAVTSPGNGAVIRVGASATLAASATDTDGNIASVQFLVNGIAQGTPITVFPYRTTWTPTAEGIYRITAIALDNATGSTTSSTVTVLATAATNSGDTVANGIIVGPTETGTFSAINARGKTATFIGVSNAGGVSRTYYFSGVPVATNGSFNAVDSLGRPTISGTFTETGAFGTLDNGRVSFSGAVTFAGAVATVAPGYYSGNLSGRLGSTLSAIIGSDGSIALYVADGTFQAAGFGAVDATGAFNILTSAGVRFTGKADPTTGFLTGTLTGGPGGTIMAATSAGVSFSDGFLRNLSTRGQVGTGANILIAGFVVGGTTPKQVLVRAVGPTLTAFGVTNALADPQLLLMSGNTVIAQNDNWSTPIGVGSASAAAISAASASVGAFALGAGSADAVVIKTLAPGNYTAQVSGVSSGTGIALVEVWDVDNPTPFSSQKVMNVATRGLVGTGQNQLIAGFVVSGNTPKKVLIRGVGPSLATVGLTAGLLADPVLRLVKIQDSVATVVRENDNWEVGNDAEQVKEAATKSGAFALTAGSKDAVILINLPPGTYTAEVTGAGSTTGLAIVEVYEVP